VGHVGENLACFAEAALQEVEGETPQIANSGDAQRLQLGGRFLSYTPELGDGKDVQKPKDVLGSDVREPVRFVHLGGQFGQEFVRADADRAGEVELSEDVPFDGISDRFGRAEESFGAGEVQKRFVNAEGLDDGRERSVDPQGLTAGMEVLGWMAHDEGPMGTQPPGRADGHSCADSESPGLIGGCGDHAPAFRVATDHQGFASEQGIIPLFDGGKKGIHIYVENCPVHPSKYTLRSCHETLFGS